MNQKAFIAGRASGKNPHIDSYETIKIKLPRKKKKAFIKKYGRESYNTKWYWSKYGASWAYAWLTQFDEILSGTDNSKKVVIGPIGIRNCLDEIAQERFESMSFNEQKHYLGDWKIRPIVRVRFYPTDTDETFDGTLIEETKYSYVVTPDDNLTGTARWNKKCCDILS